MGKLLLDYAFLWSPGVFAGLLALAAALAWLGLTPARPAHDVDTRLDGYLAKGDPVVDLEMRRPITGRLIGPALRRLLRFLGGLAPKRSVEKAAQMLMQAGNPGNITPLDFYGIQVMLIVLLSGGIFLLGLRSQPLFVNLRNALMGVIMGYLLPLYWLRARVNRRKHAILRALPDALDMLTIGVEAGLAFETALVRVGEKWDNALTRELRRAVGEMRIGTPREEALERMAERTGVPDLNTFVAVLVQSTQLGVSIAQVLHTQAAEMRMRRRQRAEELARQAGVKMVIPLVFLIFPAIFVVILGPAVPTLLGSFSNMGGAGAAMSGGLPK